MTLPLRAIHAFVTTAQLGSMVQAADRLGVTPSAISQQIQQLEAHVGTRLFARVGRRIILNEAGERYFELIREEVERIDSATQQMRGISAAQVLNLRVAPTFAVQWLLPRLPRFMQDHPEIELRVDATNDPPDFEREAIDLEIRHGNGAWAGLHVESLAEERMLPLCSPDLAAAGSLDAHSLQDHRLLHSIKNLTGWSHWFAAVGVAPKPDLQRAHFDRAHMSIALAKAGAGIALESTLTAAAEIASGALVCPVKNPPDLTQRSLWIVGPPLHFGRRRPRRFIDWLRRELAA
ncbi:LysR substrate-binding domain-containing protein [Donghicola mangrovi]|uniref:LysR family transcriptional regulator n=1 Tax=Donghicola mangrovi TaxID=2729614 RepID=A0A850Q8C1_9RHOB|nr:LysR substrate-binding domain-containing protein [Donghicola mangrovi]NVO25164.1 LysR family transcriptional regulator [Donghicola mangrovi]